MSELTKNKEKINWGILSTGEIAARMSQVLIETEDANLLAVASRSGKKSQDFAQKWDIPRSYGSYEELVQDPDIDVVYIGTPNICHYENILMCLNNGKSVLCEKPFVINYKQSQEVMELAKEKNLFLMEAHKSYFMPGIKKIRELIENDSIGKVNSLSASFCTEAPFDVNNRFFNLNMGGGALLDVGVYTILFAIYVLGYPTEINAKTVICETGVDVFSEITLKHESGGSSILTCGINGAAPRVAIIKGENGYIKVQEPFHQAPRLILKSGNNDEVEIDTSFTCKDLLFEAQRVTESLKNAETECAEFPLAKTLEILKVVDFIREKCGLKYPNE